jgi:hypothetical protein
VKALWNWLKGLFIKAAVSPPPPPEPPKPIRRKVDTNIIRTRITTLGWRLREIPIKKSHPVPEERKVIQWKLIAIKGDKSIEVNGPTIDETMKSIGKLLGVIPR